MNLICLDIFVVLDIYAFIYLLLLMLLLLLLVLLLLLLITTSITASEMWENEYGG